jgi:GTP-binding protein HflX
VNDLPLHAILVGVNLQKSNWPIKDSLSELQELAETAGIITKSVITQERQSFHPKHYIGSGKLIELDVEIRSHHATLIICDDELTPNQCTFLENKFQLKVLDRTSLILEIFAKRAQTYESQLQVEYAQLHYLMPRLTRLWTHLSRQSGGIGSRGPGETQLETDKRQIRKRMTHIKTKLKKVQDHRQLRRKKRESTPVLTCALVGYTNAGKSTVMNQLTNAGVLSENRLFATLDPTSRRFSLPNHQEVVMTDTVGFIQKLPHHLIKAFYSTLEEVTHADILLHVIDSAHSNVQSVIHTAETIISSLNAATTPTLYIFNKWDLIKKPNTTKEQFADYSPAVFISATRKETFSSFFEALTTILDTFHKTYEWLVPYAKTGLINVIRKHGCVLSETHEDTGTKIKATLPPVQAEKIMNELWEK